MATCLGRQQWHCGAYAASACTHVGALAARAEDLAAREGFAPWNGVASALRGWALVRLGLSLSRTFRRIFQPLSGHPSARAGTLGAMSVRGPARRRSASSGRADGGDGPALPAWKAFVVQFSHQSSGDTEVFSGRLEHLHIGPPRGVRLAPGPDWRTGAAARRHRGDVNVSNQPQRKKMTHRRDAGAPSGHGNSWVGLQHDPLFSR